MLESRNPERFARIKNSSMGYLNRFEIVLETVAKSLPVEQRTVNACACIISVPNDFHDSKRVGLGQEACFMT
jgi:hypothetical protein